MVWVLISIQNPWSLEHTLNVQYNDNGRVAKALNGVPIRWRAVRHVSLPLCLSLWIYLYNIYVCISVFVSHERPLHDQTNTYIYMCITHTCLVSNRTIPRFKSTNQPTTHESMTGPRDLRHIDTCGVHMCISIYVYIYTICIKCIYVFVPLGI